MQNVPLPETLLDRVKGATGVSRAPEAVRKALAEWLAQPAVTPAERLRRAGAALRADARKKHPNGMTRAQIDKLIQDARRAAPRRG